jgi:lipoprotein-anchoring transpeptidase ErfK/SrfK
MFSEKGFMRRSLLIALAGCSLATPLRAQHAPRDTGLVVSSLEAAVTRPVPEIETLGITVDISARTLYVLDGRRVVRRYPVSVGGDGFPTPQGRFRVARLIWNPAWRPPPSAWARDRHPEPPGSPSNPMGRVKIFFQEPDYYIHGTGHAGSLGRPASHGCIRMRNIDAAEVARIIMEHGGATREDGWYLETLQNDSTSREVQLRAPVTLRVRA